MPFCSDFWGFVVVSAMFGCFLSAWCALTPPAIVDMAGVDLLTSGFGTLTFVRGFAALIGEYWVQVKLKDINDEKAPDIFGLDFQNLSKDFKKMVTV